MATTPPLQMVSLPDTPPAPLHGAAYDRRNPRRTTRFSTRSASGQVCTTPDASRELDPKETSVTTPRSCRQSSFATLPGLYSPQATPRNKSARRVQVISPPSPNPDLSNSEQLPPSKAHLQQFTSSSTTISDGMLPTPVKTPRKKMVSKVTGAARALFQDSTHAATDLAAIEPSPRRSRKKKRYNGFSLESFSAGDDSSRGQIQIFTDSRDRVPQVDKSKANPFTEDNMDNAASSVRKVTGTSKRRKVSGGKKPDPQVEEAIRKDEGMVYVFRGKKVYRRFDDGEDEEEEIDADDLGLLEHSPTSSHTKPLKTLTRRSIRPTRLFQSEEQKQTRELEKEEEALTDIDDTTITMNGDLSAGEGASNTNGDDPTPKTGRSLRSAAKTSAYLSDGGDNETGVRSTKKVSPFDSWPRVKRGMRFATSTSKGKKRVANEAIDESFDTPGAELKRTKA